MSKLTDTQLVVLSAAAKRDNASAVPLPASLKLSARSAASVVKRLVAKKLLAEVPAHGNLPAYREDASNRVALTITEAGLSALGIGAKIDGMQKKEKRRWAALTEKSRSAPTKIERNKSRTSPRDPASPSLPRSGSKLDTLVGILSTKDGANLARLTKATGWQPHTVRAALTRLRQRGIAIERVKSETGETVYKRIGA